MKKYITPNTEYTYLTLTEHILGVSQNNQGVFTDPDTSVGPNQIGKRVF